MPSKPAPRKPANKPPMKPGRPNKPPVGAGVGAVAGRWASEPPGWPGWVMLRSIGRVVGEVAVDGVAAMAPSASSGRRRKPGMSILPEANGRIDMPGFRLRPLLALGAIAATLV